MKQEDNIHQFFQKKLGQSKPTEADWNTPSDDIWHRAKAEFPKKKKRKPFFFALLGFGTVLLFTIAFYWISPSSFSIEKGKQKLELNPTASTVAAQPIPTINAKGNQENQENQTDTNQSQNEGKDATTQSSTNQIANNLPTKNEIAAHKTEGVAEQTTVVVPTSNSNARSTITNSLGKQKQSITAIPPTEFVPGTSLSTTPVNASLAAIPSEQLTEPTEPISATPADTLAAIAAPARKDLAFVAAPRLGVNLRDEEVEILAKTVPLVRPRIMPRWEIGFSHAPLILDLEKLFEEENSENNDTVLIGQEQLDINVSYVNFNIPITRRLNRSLSLTSGVSFTKLGLDFIFSTTEVFDSAETDKELKSFLKKKSSAGSLTLNDASSVIDIEYLPGAMLMDGDTFLIEGIVPVEADVVQIPILLNYHFGRGRVEGLLHTGISLDYYRSSIKNLSLKVYKDDALITAPVAFNALNDEMFDFSLYAGAGMKFHLTDRFNIGLSAKVNFALLPLSRYEIGVYYGL